MVRGIQKPQNDLGEVLWDEVVGEYGQAQTEKEGAALFLEQRHVHARRLFPNAPEQQIIGILVEALRASMEKLLRSSTFDTVGKLVIRARQIEQDEQDERNASRRNV